MQSGNNILLVEDDKYIALALKIRLQAEGYLVTVVYKAACALRSVDESVPDIALIDYNLPDGNGIELLQRFAQTHKTQGIVSIVMTASNKQGLREQALSAGAFDYFSKPFNSSKLIDSIKSAGAFDDCQAV